MVIEDPLSARRLKLKGDERIACWPLLTKGENLLVVTRSGELLTVSPNSLERGGQIEPDSTPVATILAAAHILRHTEANASPPIPLSFTYYRPNKGSDGFHEERLVSIERLWQSRDGATLLSGFDHHRRDVRSFRADRILYVGFGDKRCREWGGLKLPESVVGHIPF